MSPAEIVYTVSMILLTGALLLFAKAMYVMLSRFDVNHELTEADNPAIGTAMFGYLLGLVFVIAGLLATELPRRVTRESLAWDLAETAIFGVVAVFLLRLSGWINDRFILHRFENKKELVDDRNVGAGAVLCGTYIASGLILAGALHGRLAAKMEAMGHWELIGRELLTALVFFGLGQVVLIIYGQIIQRLSKVNPLDSIEQDYEVDGRKHGGNTAAGIAVGGNMVAMGIVLWGAARGDFISWKNNLTAFGVVVGVGLVALPLWRLFVDHVLLGKVSLATEINEDRNPNAALLESVALIALAVVIAFMARPDFPA